MGCCKVMAYFAVLFYWAAKRSCCCVVEQCGAMGSLEYVDEPQEITEAELAIRAHAQAIKKALVAVRAYSESPRPELLDDLKRAEARRFDSFMKMNQKMRMAGAGEFAWKSA